MFFVQAVHVETGEVEEATFELTPKVERAEKLCRVFGEWLGGQPAEFRERIPFVTRGDVELDWSAASEGVAYAALMEGGETRSVSVMVSGMDAEADGAILGGLAEMAPGYTPRPERPLLAMVLFPGAPEAIPMVQALTTALASVFFRAVLGLREREAGK